MEIPTVHCFKDLRIQTNLNDTKTKRATAAAAVKSINLHTLLYKHNNR